jgi:alpha-mannosidase
MPTPLLIAVEGLEVFCREVIAPAVAAASVPLSAAAWQTPDPVPAAVARGQRFKPVKPGWQWGPSWSTAWFRLQGRVPAALAGRRLHLSFSSDTEALLFLGDVPHAGFDANRDLAPLPPAALRAGRVDFFVEAACNHLFGARGLQWEGPEIHARWNSRTPGRFLHASLVAVDQPTADLRDTFTFACQLLRELDPGSPPAHTPTAPWMPNQPLIQNGRAEELHTALRQARAAITSDDPAAVRAAAPAALRILMQALRRPAGASATVCHAVGHAHIDTAWLWPLRETRRKCQRTFSNVLRLMESHPDFVFMASQPQQYAFIEQDAPELFRQIRRRVTERRWQPVGGMWIEPDCNVPSGESLARQLLHGIRYFTDRFGPEGRQRMLYLPDTFGFPPCLPQLMAAAGLDTFVTNKLSWNDTNPFPFTTFRWQGLSRHTVLAHSTPGCDYNAVNTPRELLRGDRCHRSKHIPSLPSIPNRPANLAGGARWLQPFGFGDGGGGPTAWSIRNIDLASDCDGLPRTLHDDAHHFCQALHDDVAAARRAGIPIDQHTGELYLELHRGVLSTHTRFKQLHRRCEHALRTAETMLVYARHIFRTAPEGSAVLSADREALDRAWKLLLLNQFHDILPGSSIPQVYTDGFAQLSEVLATAQRIIDQGLLHATKHLPASSAAFNPAAALQAGAPPLGFTPSAAPAPATPATPAPAVTITRARNAITLTSGTTSAIIDSAGRITRLSVAGHTLSGPLNDLHVHRDRPRMWDAWDIDAAHTDSVNPITAAGTVRVTTAPSGAVTITIGPVTQHGIRVTRALTLVPGENVIRCTSTLHALQRRQLVRAVFPAAPAAAPLRLIHGTQHGWLTRPTHANTPQQRAAFEFPAHGFAALGDSASRLLVMADGLYGWSCPRGTAIGLTLLRTPNYPDPGADDGPITFTYAVGIDTGPEAPGRLALQADAFARPILPLPASPARQAAASAPEPTATGRPLEGLVEVLTPHPISIEAIKLAEDDDRVIIRLCELSGAPQTARLCLAGLRALQVHRCDLLESPLGPPLRPTREGELPLKLDAFELVTLAVDVARPPATRATPARRAAGSKRRRPAKR